MDDTWKLTSQLKSPGFVQLPFRCWSADFWCGRSGDWAGGGRCCSGRLCAPPALYRCDGCGCSCGDWRCCRDGGIRSDDRIHTGDGGCCTFSNTSGEKPSDGSYRAWTVSDDEATQAFGDQQSTTAAVESMPPLPPHPQPSLPAPLQFSPCSSLNRFGGGPAHAKYRLDSTNEDGPVGGSPGCVTAVDEDIGWSRVSVLLSG